MAHFSGGEAWRRAANLGRRPIRRHDPPLGVLAAVSLASDVGHDQPLEKSLRNAVVATRLGMELGLGRQDLSDAYYVALLRSMGCTANAHETAALFGGDDRAVAGMVQILDVADPVAWARAASDRARSWAADAAAERATEWFLRQGRQLDRESGRAACEVATTLARRLGLAPTVQTGLDQVYERWDGPERVRLHSYYTERILARTPAFAGLARLAGSDHERIDGTGYHRSVEGDGLTEAMRLLACADGYVAMTSVRPHRPALAPAAAAAELRAEARTGGRCPEATEAVLEAAGHRRARREPAPCELTPREVEVLGLLARGMTNKEIAGELFLSPRTVGHHVAHVYDKIDRRTRAGAAMFALEHRLLAAGRG